MARARPPEDITPADFFTRWVPQAVAGDEARRSRFVGTQATVEFHLRDAAAEVVEVFTIEIADGQVTGAAGEAHDPALRVRVDLETWRALNRGDVAAPQALLSRRLVLEGDFLLGLKLHLILG
jgi:putative sterol carrier protein